jgi:hypothetical protein
MFKIFDLSKVETIVKYKYYTVHIGVRDGGQGGGTAPLSHPPPNFFLKTMEIRAMIL